MHDHHPALIMGFDDTGQHETIGDDAHAILTKAHGG